MTIPLAKLGGHALRAFCATAVAVAAASEVASAQTGPMARESFDWSFDSGPLANPSARAEVLVSEPVEVRGAPWIRVYFENVVLSPGSVVRVTGHREGWVQELDTVGLRQWNNASAYFNGDAVQVELVAAPGASGDRLGIRSTEIGALGSFETICGPVDDRQPSNDARQGRMVPVGCTAWLLDDCNHCLLAAGHCISFGGNSQTIEFNVPPSLSNGTIQHPPPQDQYPMDASSVQDDWTVIGNDWTYFGVFTNGTTGLTAGEAQGAFYTLADPPAFDPSIQIRITGYGTSAIGPLNQVQKTHLGPMDSGSGGTILRYATDTTGGNSGSPIVDEGTGLAIGIHTNGGCGSTGGSNSGTGVNNPGLQAAMANPLGVCTPDMGNPDVTSYCTGKLNSLGCMPFISSVGAPSVTQSVAFQVRANDMIPNEAALLSYSHNGRSNLDFHGGKLCVKAPFVRLLPVKIANANGSPPCTGSVTINFNNRIQSGNDPLLTAGAQVNAQYRGRDAALGDGFNDSLTDGLEFSICP